MTTENQPITPSHRALSRKLREIFQSYTELRGASFETPGRDLGKLPERAHWALLRGTEATEQQIANMSEVHRAQLGQVVNWSRDAIAALAEADAWTDGLTFRD